MLIELIYLIVVFVICILWFLVFKRPLYEAMLLAFVAIVATVAIITGEFSFGAVWNYIWDAMTTPSLYVIFAFIVSAALLSKTSVIDDCIAIILSIFGRFRGGAGYVSIIASSYMGSLSGSGPGNVATTGVFTIPAMKRSGFPAHLAANVEAHSSTMGNMIPPAGMVAIAFDHLSKTQWGESFTMSQFWLVLWGIALWFILQRIVTLYVMCRYYKVEAMNKEEIPPFWATLKRGWKAVLLPIIVFLPFMLNSTYEEFFVKQLGAKSTSVANAILLMIPSLIVVMGIFLSDKKALVQMTPKKMFGYIENGMLKVVPTAALVLFAYFVSNVFAQLNVEVAVGEFIQGFNLPKIALVLIIPLFTAVLGMLLPGSTQVKIFGGIIVGLFASVGIEPMLSAAMLLCICGAMHGVTPPYCACVYVAMGIAESELKPTMVNTLVWIFIHYVLSVLVLLGFLPVLGLVSVL
ncbi:MAG: TRAP transporter large permease subunit [Clostridia bacterium]|nr:TRAP transporter large permease subunit [Clostridia bacterium]